jgi:hypothetical protein
VVDVASPAVVEVSPPMVDVVVSSAVVVVSSSVEEVPWPELGTLLDVVSPMAWPAGDSVRRSASAAIRSTATPSLGSNMLTDFIQPSFLYARLLRPTSFCPPQLAEGTANLKMQLPFVKRDKA